MNCHHTVLRYGLQLERGIKGRRRSRKAMKATADSAGDRRGTGKREDFRKSSAVRKTGRKKKIRQRRKESKESKKVKWNSPYTQCEELKDR